MPSNAVHLHPLFQPEPRNDAHLVQQLNPDGTGIVCLAVSPTPTSFQVLRSVLGVNQQQREQQDLPTDTMVVWLSNAKGGWELTLVVPTSKGWLPGIYMVHLWLDGKYVRRPIEVPSCPFSVTHDDACVRASWVACSAGAEQVAFSTGFIAQPQISLQDLNDAPYTLTALKLVPESPAGQWLVTFTEPLTRDCKLYWVVV